MKTILIADPHDHYRKTMIRLLSKYNLIGDTKDGVEATSLVKLKKPDLLIIELSLLKAAGPSIIKEMLSSHDKLKILVMTMHTTEDRVKFAFDEGVHGCFIKDGSLEELQSAMCCILNGGIYLCAAVRDSKTGMEKQAPACIQGPTFH